MQTQTLFLTVDLLDKMLLLIPVKKAQFQLLGCACLFVASKFEEIEVGQGRQNSHSCRVAEYIILCRASSPPSLCSRWMQTI